MTSPQIERIIALPALVLIVAGCFVLPGVPGGVPSFGIVGVFLGPTLLAVACALIRDWTRSAPPPPAG